MTINEYTKLDTLGFLPRRNKNGHEDLAAECSAKGHGEVSSCCRPSEHLRTEVADEENDGQGGGIDHDEHHGLQGHMAGQEVVLLRGPVEQHAT